MHTKTPLTILISYWLLIYCIPAIAGRPSDTTEADMALLPGYCRNAQSFNYDGINGPTTTRWVATMGSGFYSIHHYCWARIELSRSERATSLVAQKMALRGSARSNLLYVIDNSPSDFVLLPEIYTWLGRVEILSGRSSDADRAFAKARSLKPDYWPAYYHWAEWLASKGKKAEALAIVKTGLQQSPQAKPLGELFRSLGGKPSDIPPPLPKLEEPQPPEGSETRQSAN